MPSFWCLVFYLIPSNCDLEKNILLHTQLIFLHRKDAENRKTIKILSDMEEVTIPSSFQKSIIRLSSQSE